MKITSIVALALLATSAFGFECYNYDPYHEKLTVTQGNVFCQANVMLSTGEMSLSGGSNPVYRDMLKARDSCVERVIPYDNEGTVDTVVTCSCFSDRCNSVVAIKKVAIKNGSFHATNKK